MKLNIFDRVVLALAVIFLGIIALHPVFPTEVARAQATTPNYYVEPGIKTLFAPDRTKQVQGKIMVDLNNGNIWGFPTSQEVPCPIDPVKPQPATSSPIYLGKFDLAATQRNQ